MMENPTQTNPEIQSGELQQPAPEQRSGVVSRVIDTIYFVLGAVEVLLAVNLFLRLFGGNPLNPIVHAVYDLTYPLIYPFMDMFRQPFRFDRPIGLLPETLIAMLAYMAVVWVLVNVIQWITRHH